MLQSYERVIAGRLHGSCFETKNKTETVISKIVKKGLKVTSTRQIDDRNNVKFQLTRYYFYPQPAAIVSHFDGKLVRWLAPKISPTSKVHVSGWDMAAETLSS